MTKISPISQSFIQTKRNITYTNPLYIRREEETDKNNQFLIKKNIILGTGLLASIIGLAIYFRKGYFGNIQKQNQRITNPFQLPNIYKGMIATTEEEVDFILAKLTANDFDSTKNFRANLHIHSTKSDGQLSPVEILDQALEQANKLPENEKFIFSLTDHDNVDGVVEIIDKIVRDPDKYKKIKFIPGLELSVKYHNSDLSKKPAILDLLIYGFKVCDKKLLSEINRRRNYLTEKTIALMEDIVQKGLASEVDINQLKGNDAHGILKNICSNGYLKTLKTQLRNYLGDNYDGKSINELFIKHFGDDKFAYDANLSLEDALKLTKDLNALSSIAHPGLLNFKHSEVQGDHMVLAKDIFSKFAKEGGSAIESHYMSYKQGQHWWDKLESAFNEIKNNYLKTGGYDTHGRNIAKK